jgi:hypothetical protein
VLHDDAVDGRQAEAVPLPGARHHLEGAQQCGDAFRRGGLRAPQGRRNPPSPHLQRYVLALKVERANFLFAPPQLQHWPVTFEVVTLVHAA